LTIFNFSEFSTKKKSGGFSRIRGFEVVAQVIVGLQPLGGLLLIKVDAVVVGRGEAVDKLLAPDDITKATGWSSCCHQSIQKEVKFDIYYNNE